MPHFDNNKIKFTVFEFYPHRVFVYSGKLVDTIHIKIGVFYFCEPQNVLINHKTHTH